MTSGGPAQDPGGSATTLDDLFRRALAKDPGERFDNCRTLLLEAGRCARPAPAGTPAASPRPAGADPATGAGARDDPAPTVAAHADAPHADHRRTPDVDVDRLGSAPVDEPEGRGRVVWRWLSRIGRALTLLLVIAAVVLGLSRGAFAGLAVALPAVATATSPVGTPPPGAASTRAWPRSGPSGPRSPARSATPTPSTP